MDVADDGDELIEIVEDVLEWHGEAFIPGKYLVEAFPILQHIPPWVPGATVQRLSLHWRSTVVRLREQLDRLAKVPVPSSPSTAILMKQHVSFSLGG